MKTQLISSSAKLRLVQVQFLAFVPFVLSVLALFLTTGCSTSNETLVVDHSYLRVNKAVQCETPSCQVPIYFDINSTSSFEKKATYDKYNQAQKDILIECLINANQVCKKSMDNNLTQ